MSRVLLAVIRLYQATKVPGSPNRCRYLPTCSNYAQEAIAVHGPARGGWLAIRRIGRCHPFGSFGFDPVPTSES